MTGYIVRRLLSLIPVLIGVTFLVFLVMQLAPGDPAQIMLGPKATETSLAQLRHDYLRQLEASLGDPSAPA